MSHVITTLYEPYTPEEMQRYSTAARDSGAILHELAHWVKPGMTERQVVARAWELYVAHGFEGLFMFVGADDRIRRYRHAVPGDKPIETAVLLAPCGSRGGLHVPNSRLVYFEEPSADIRRRFHAVATMQAAMLATIRPGVKLAALREIVWGLFESLGYPEERYVHFHGGPIGYAGSLPERCLDPEAVVAARMAFAWYFTVAARRAKN
jgi:Xaa-Pro aminopeptidase